MPNINNYKQERRQALIRLYVFGFLFMGLFSCILFKDLPLYICIPMIIGYVEFHVRYHIRCAKIEILNKS